MGNAIHIKSGFVTSFLRSRNGWWHSLWNEYAMASYEIRYKIIQTRKSFGAIQAYSDPAMMAEQNLKTMLLSYMKKHENVSRRRLVFFLFVLRYLLHTWWINFLFFTLESSLTGCKNYSVFQFSHFLFFLQCRSENLAHFHLLGTAAVSECVSQRAGRWPWSGRHEIMLWEHIANLGCEAHRIKYRFQRCERSWIDRVYIWRQGCGESLILSFCW